jgi:hypothetical protein
MAIGDRSFSIQSRLASFLVLLFPTIKDGTRHLKFPTGFGDTEMICKLKDDNLEPDPQFFLGFFVHLILRFTL